MEAHCPDTIHVELSLSRFTSPVVGTYFRASVEARSHPDRDRGADIGEATCDARSAGEAVRNALAQAGAIT